MLFKAKERRSECVNNRNVFYEDHVIKFQTVKGQRLFFARLSVLISCYNWTC